MRLGLFGGTFNPIHMGHLIVAQWVLEDAALDRILFIPSASPPHKREVLSYRHRSRMVALAIEDNPAFELCEIEAERDGPSYTADTLEELKRLYKGEFHFIIGTEAFLNIHTWHQPPRVLSQTSIVVMERAGFEVSSEELQRYLKVLSLRFPQVEFYHIEGRVWRCEVEGASNTLRLTPVPQIGISSSMIRGRLGEGLGIKYLVKGEVEEYIGEHGLYRS